MQACHEAINDGRGAPMTGDPTQAAGHPGPRGSTEGTQNWLSGVRTRTYPAQFLRVPNRQGAFLTSSAGLRHPLVRDIA
jgi:hypothetical protein